MGLMAVFSAGKGHNGRCPVSVECQPMMDVACNDTCTCAPGGQLPSAGHGFVGHPSNRRNRLLSLSRWTRPTPYSSSLLPANYYTIFPSQVLLANSSVPTSLVPSSQQEWCHHGQGHANIKVQGDPGICNSTQTTCTAVWTAVFEGREAPSFPQSRPPP